jgi:hypothetical protein
MLRVSVALGIQDAMRVRHIVTSSVGCLAVKYSSNLTQKRHNFEKKERKKNIDPKTRVLILCTTFV